MPISLVWDQGIPRDAADKLREFGYECVHVGEVEMSTEAAECVHSVEARFASERSESATLGRLRGVIVCNRGLRSRGTGAD